MSSHPRPPCPWRNPVRPSQREGTNLAFIRMLQEHGLTEPGALEAAVAAALPSPTPPWQIVHHQQQQQQQRASPTPSGLAAAQSAPHPSATAQQPSSSFASTATAVSPAARSRSSVQLGVDWTARLGREHSAFSAAQARRYDPRHGSRRPALSSVGPSIEHRAPSSPLPSQHQDQDMRGEGHHPGRWQWRRSVPWTPAYQPQAAHYPQEGLTRVVVESYDHAEDTKAATPSGLVGNYTHDASHIGSETDGSVALPAQSWRIEYSSPSSAEAGGCCPSGNAPPHGYHGREHLTAAVSPIDSPSAWAHRPASTYAPLHLHQEANTAPASWASRFRDALSTRTFDYYPSYDRDDVDMTSASYNHHRRGEVEYDIDRPGPSNFAAAQQMAATSRATAVSTNTPTSLPHYDPRGPPRWYSYEQAGRHEPSPAPYAYWRCHRAWESSSSLEPAHFEGQPGAHGRQEPEPFFWQRELDRQVPVYTSVDGREIRLAHD